MKNLLYFFLFQNIFVKMSCEVVKLVIDTDMDFDVDDVGALCAAHALETLGEAQIMAIVHNVGYPKAIGAVSVINHYYGRDNISLGAFKGKFGENIAGPYIDDLVDNFESPIKHYDQVDDAVQVLRKTLAKAEDNSIVIVSVGFLNNIAQLLLSQDDNISNLSGYELVAKKVKSVFIMGGYYPESDLFSEFNFNCGENFMGDAEECFSSAKTAVSMMPPQVRMVFSGFEVGFGVMSGGALTSCAAEDNPCRKAYIDVVGTNHDRSSWDPLTLVAAVRGAAAVSCEETGVGGKNEVLEDGNNFWINDVEGGSNQTYLTLNDPVAPGLVIDELLCL